MPNDSPFLSTKTAATRIGYSESTLEKLCCTGGGPPFIRTGGRITYDVADLDALDAGAPVRLDFAVPEEGGG
jgi:hypothetical protein